MPGALVFRPALSSTSVQEYIIGLSVPAVELIRGSDWGGGVGGVLYTVRDGDGSYNAYNSRGDVVSRTNDAAAITWQGAYEAFGTRTQEEGATEERQAANTKDEDPTGLLNEGFRYRDLEFGIFLTRDPMGFVDGPNVYTYVRQNPWSSFDPDGLWMADIFGAAISASGKMANDLGHNIAKTAIMVELAAKVVVGADADSAVDRLQAVIDHQESYGNEIAESSAYMTGGDSESEVFQNAETIIGMLLPEPSSKTKVLSKGDEVLDIVKKGVDKGSELLGDSSRIARNFADDVVEEAAGESSKLSKLIPDPDGGFTADLSKTKAKSRSGHSYAGNKQLHEKMKNDPVFRKKMEAKHGEDVFERTSTSNGGRRNPRDTEWDHNSNDLNALDLRTKANHRTKTTIEGQGGGGFKKLKDKQKKEKKRKKIRKGR